MSTGAAWGRTHLRPNRLEGLTVRTVGFLCLVFLVAPLVVVGASSLDPGEFFTFPPTSVSIHWYRAFVTSEQWRSSTYLSLQIAVLTAVVSTLVGGFAGIAMARLSKRTRTLFYPVLVGPLILPTVILATFFYRLVLEIHAVGRLASFVTANSLLTSSLVALLVMSSALGIDRHLEYASLACGAGPLRTLIWVTIPMVAPTAAAGAVFAFMWALGDVVMSVFLVAPGRTPLAVEMFGQIRTGTSPIVTAASTLLIVVPLVFIGMLAPLRNLAVRGRGAPGASDLLDSEEPKVLDAA